MLGGGSNLVVADDGFDGTVVEVATRGISADDDGDDASCGGVLVTVAAGEAWDDLVAPGRRARLGRRRGAVRHPRARSARRRSRTSAPTARRSRRPSRRCGSGTATLRGVRTFANADCGFGYRTSRFKADPGRHVVLDVTFQLRAGRLGAPVAYAELARTLGVEPGAARAARPTSARRSWACAAARAWCSTRPTTTPGAPARSSPTRSSTPTDVPDGAPAWPQADGRVKTSAAWLIEHAGFGKGYGAGRGRRCPTSTPWRSPTAAARRTDELLALAREVRDGVEAAYGIRLVNEPVLVGCELVLRSASDVRRRSRSGDWCRQPRRSIPVSRRFRTSSGAAEARTDIRASSASCASSARGRPASWRTGRPAGTRRAAGRRRRAPPSRRPRAASAAAPSVRSE